MTPLGRGEQATHVVVRAACLAPGCLAGQLSLRKTGGRERVPCPECGGTGRVDREVALGEFAAAVFRAAKAL